MAVFLLFLSIACMSGGHVEICPENTVCCFNVMPDVGMINILPLSTTFTINTFCLSGAYEQNVWLLLCARRSCHKWAGKREYKSRLGLSPRSTLRSLFNQCRKLCEVDFVQLILSRKLSSLMQRTCKMQITCTQLFAMWRLGVNTACLSFETVYNYADFLIFLIRLAAWLTVSFRVFPVKNYTI